MAPRRLASAVLLSLAFAGGGVLLAGCGSEEEEEAHREGLRVEMGGLDYNVFITRQLNPSLASDEAYYDGPDLPAGRALYGVFIEVCNRGKGTHPSAGGFKIRDNQDQDFEPVDVPETNKFVYRPQVLGPRECIPRTGSISQLGPTAGALLLFDLPLEATENRPLILEVEPPEGAEDGHPIEFRLDI